MATLIKLICTSVAHIKKKSNKLHSAGQLVKINDHTDCVTNDLYNLKVHRL
jgi:hypothetical protein